VAAGLVMRRHWLAVLQHAARSGEHVAIAVPRVVRSNGHIESAGLARKGGELGRRYESKPEDYGPALVPVPVIAAERSCIYLDRRALRTVAPTGDTPDVCDQFWQTGWQIVYAPSAEARRSTHVAIPAVPDDRRAPQKRPRSRRVKLGASRDIIYVTENTAIGGGHRDVFEHLNGLAARGHRAELYTLGSAPGWFDLRVPVRSFSDYGALAGALAPLDAVKVATWWATAEPVWRASVARGIPAYFVQDIETSYYPDDQRARFRVLASYREEFRYMTISNWNRERLAELGLSAELIAPGVDLATFAPRPAIHRRRDMVLALGRTLPLKNFPLSLAAWRALSRPRPELRLFGSEPQLADEAGIVYEERPTDERVAELLCEASVFVATSTHEGFCLPVLEAMACGTPVVCTDAHGNRDFCVDGENCLMPSARAEDVAAAIARLLGDADLRRRLGQAGLETAASYSWKPRIDALERFMHGVANRDHAAAAC
jgi:glycosyltransferase involved in cell wall biosynthesis